MKQQGKEYLNPNNFLCPRQFGFRKKMSTPIVILATEFATKKLGKKTSNRLSLSINSLRFLFPENFASEATRETQFLQLFNLGDLKFLISRTQTLYLLEFIIYINSMHLHVTEEVKTVQNVDDTFFSLPMKP